MNEDRRFRFVGVDSAGNKKKGVVEARSKGAALTLLEQGGISVQGIQQEDTYREPPGESEAETIPPRLSNDDPVRVTVIDFDMDFMTMVWFMIKWTVATIPAAIFLAAVVFFCALLFGMLTGR